MPKKNLQTSTKHKSFRGMNYPQLVEAMKAMIETCEVLEDTDLVPYNMRKALKEILNQFRDPKPIPQDSMSGAITRFMARLDDNSIPNTEFDIPAMNRWATQTRIDPIQFAVRPNSNMTDIESYINGIWNQGMGATQFLEEIRYGTDNPNTTNPED